jgi:hypothetical protein
MTGETSWWRRLALITCLVERSPTRVLRRTAIVKLTYLLQVLRGVPVGYAFRLYTYGPFDADVLADLDTARSLEAVTVKTIDLPSGYAYEVRPGPVAEVVKARASEWLTQHEADIDWVVRAFANRTASELELLATCIYADRELADRGHRDVPVGELVRRVRDVKPHFSEAQVARLVEEGQREGWLLAVPRPQANGAGM